MDLKKLAAGPDYFANVGDIIRIVAAVVLTPFAIFFTLGALATPIAAVSIAISGDLQIAGIVLGSGLLYALLAVPLCWLTFRLFRGRKSANGVTVLPTWLIRTFLIGYLGPLSIGVAVGMAIMAVDAALNERWMVALLLAVGTVGWIVGLIRGIGVAFRLGKRATEESVAKKAQPPASL